MSDLFLVGTSHHHAPVELRERVAVPREQVVELARALAGAKGEAVCLSTCNRTELYMAGPDAEARAEAALLELSGLREDELAPALYRLRDEAAALHLFRVAAGLDSLVPGEGEILGQVRSAYEAGATGPVLDRVFRQALHSGKKVRAQTAIGESPASVSSAAAALAQQVFGDLRGTRILIIGAGKVSELAARNLISRGAEIAWVANRTLDAAVELARRLGGEALPLDRAVGELRNADVVVSSTSAPDFVLLRDEVEPAVTGRKGRPLLFVDLAVPRDLDPEIGRLPDCYLYDIDDLEAVVAETLAGRRQEGERAEAIVAEEAERFPRVARVARRRAGDRVAARAGRGDPHVRAREGRGSARTLDRGRAPRGRVGDRADREQAPASPDRADEAGSRGSRWGGLC